MGTWRVRMSGAGLAALAVAVVLTAAVVEPGAATAGVQAPAVRLGGAAAGSGWSLAKTPVLTSDDDTLTGISCPTSTFCAAVGWSATTTTFEGRPLAETWDGARWTVSALPAARSLGILESVSCVTATSCTAVGFAGLTQDDNPQPESDARAEVVHWDGHQWTTEVAPQPAGATMSALLGVSCLSGGFCEAVGRSDTAQGDVPLAESRVGGVWRVQAAATPPAYQPDWLQAVACSSPAACTAVGVHYINVRANQYAALAERWNGSTWRPQATAALPDPATVRASAFTSVSCPTVDRCWAVGTLLLSTVHGRTSGLAETWDGTAWHAEIITDPIHNNVPTLNGISCTSATSCLAVGSYSDQDLAEGKSLTLITHWNGTTWTPQDSPSPPGAIANGQTLTSVSCRAGAACGVAGHHTSTALATLTLVELHEPGGWRIVATPSVAGQVGGLAAAVSCTSATTCTLVGHIDVAVTGGTAPFAETSTSGGWKAAYPPLPPATVGGALAAVSCHSSTCTAVGQTSSDNVARNLLFADRFDGTTWTEATIPYPTAATSAALTAVSCVTAWDCMAVGSYNTTAAIVPLVVVSDRAGWRVLPSAQPTGAANPTLTGVSCLSTSFCMVTGVARPLAWTATWNGSRWAVQIMPQLGYNDDTEMLGVSCTSETACTAVGTALGAEDDITAAERWDGTAWHAQPTPTPPNAILTTLTGVSCTSATACTAIGTFQPVQNGSPLLQDTITLVWSGTRWTSNPMSIPGNATGLWGLGISCTTAATCTAVGSYDTTALQLPLVESERVAS